MTLSPTLQQATSKYLQQAHTTDSLSLRNAKAQAISSLMSFLQTSTHLTITHTSLADISLDLTNQYLSHLQQTRSIETEHLYTRVLINFLTTSHPTQTNELDPHTKTLIDYIAANRRPRPHTIHQPPIAAITELLATAHNLQTSDTPHPTDRQVLQALRDRAIIYVLADTGLRPSEVCNLSETDFQDNTLMTSEVHIGITPQTSAYIRQYLAARAAHHLKSVSVPHLFARHDKRASAKLLPISRWTLANIIASFVDRDLSPATKQLLARNHIAISPISFRHYFVFSMLMTTNDLETTQLRARHKDIATTRQYLKQPPRNIK